MERTELLAAIEEDAGPELADLARRDPEDAADALEYRAREHDDDAKTKNGDATRSTYDVRREHATLAENCRLYAAELRRIVEEKDAA